MIEQDKDSRLEKARLAMLATLESLRNGVLTPKEADAIEAAIEDELISLRGSSLLSGSSV
jgi:hypothetical protein